jgi:hypothetical protein
MTRGSSKYKREKIAKMTMIANIKISRLITGDEIMGRSSHEFFVSIVDDGLFSINIPYLRKKLIYLF